MSERSSSLLATIRTALDASPPAVAEPGTLRLHTLFSIPRQAKSLYPLAHIHPTDLEYNKKAASVGALEEQIFVTASWAPRSAQNVEQATVDATDKQEGGETRPPKETERDTTAPLLILAMELYLYTVPELGSAVLYVSKLDSSGYGPKAIPTPLRDALSGHVFSDGSKFGNTLTATLSSAVTQHFTSFRHWDRPGQHSSSVSISHLSVHILARSQRAYLFPSSPENKDKKVLSDGGLIKWWRAVMSDVVVSTRDASSPVRKSDNSQAIDARAYYVIPGYSKMESHPLVPLIREGSSSTTAEQVLKQANWTYGYPYSSSGAGCAESDLPPLPLHWQTSSFVLSQSGKGKAEAQMDPEASDYDPKKVRTVPTLMPHFSDDPKTRFLDEMARDAHEHAGWKEKTAITSNEPVKVPGVMQEEKENGIEEQLDVSEFKSEDGNDPKQSESKKRAADD
ncbi:hypothetical protein, partial [Sporisorium scitamineum]